ncbi:MAG: prepilin-type N-terminal cleavage/methylation domain-containing protein [Myxococcota bacterium]
MTGSGQRRGAHGFTLVELLAAVAIAAVLVGGLIGVVQTTLAASEDTRVRNDLAAQAEFAMDRIARAIRGSQVLLVPLDEDPSTGNSESIIEPGLLAVSLDPSLDLDQDGIADADNDGDGLVDEDLPGDSTNDARPGVRGIDDDNSGITDVSFAGSRDDDETGFVRDEDPINGLDDDGDGSIDEDPPADMNGDGAPGVAGVDDDGDGSVDEGDVADDDEDGTSDEDWYDVVAYFVSGQDLIERHPDLDPTDGTDYTERTIASPVVRFRVERLPRDGLRATVVDVLLELGSDPTTVTVQRRVRVAGADG